MNRDDNEAVWDSSVKLWGKQGREERERDALDDAERVEQLTADLAAAKEAYEGVQQEMDKEHDECMKLVETYKDLADTFRADLAAMTAERDAMRERAEIPEVVISTLEQMGDARCIDGGCPLSQAARTFWMAWAEWRGPVAGNPVKPILPIGVSVASEFRGPFGPAEDEDD